jgi:hypothetical protein
MTCLLFLIVDNMAQDRTGKWNTLPEEFVFRPPVEPQVSYVSDVQDAPRASSLTTQRFESALRAFDTRRAASASRNAYPPLLTPHLASHSQLAGACEMSAMSLHQICDARRSD